METLRKTLTSLLCFRNNQINSKIPKESNASENITEEAMILQERLRLAKMIGEDFQKKLPSITLTSMIF